MPEPKPNPRGKAEARPAPVVKDEHPLIVKFRKELLNRNVAGIKSIGMTFRQCDDNHSGNLTLMGSTSVFCVEKLF
jgi:hypothetical protein